MEGSSNSDSVESECEACLRLPEVFNLNKQGSGATDVAGSVVLVVVIANGTC